MVSVNFLVIWVIIALFVNAAVAAVREYRKWVRETEAEDLRAREEWAGLTALRSPGGTPTWNLHIGPGGSHDVSGQ